MKVSINPRGNGACPLCIYNKKCLVQETLEKTLNTVYANGELGVVIYNCSKFLESNKE
jgi:hypothetical protein